MHNKQQQQTQGGGELDFQICHIMMSKSTFPTKIYDMQRNNKKITTNCSWKSRHWTSNFKSICFNTPKELTETMDKELRKLEELGLT